MNKNTFVNRLFTIRNEHVFNKMALSLFSYQYQNVELYRNFVDIINRPYPRHYTEIPFLPISFFKTHRIAQENATIETVFKSSGTTGQVRSQHFIENTALYIRSFENTYRSQIGNPEQQVILALLPNYVQQGDSSLVFMVAHLIRQSASSLSQFVLEDFDRIQELYLSAIEEGKEVILFGVSYALLDLAKTNISLPKAKIIETGGMKGRREELTKEQLHETLKDSFQVSQIYSEYGMTELLSQAYSTQDGWFKTPAWMKISIGDVYDAFSEMEEGKTGRIRVIDLANFYSCSFIETEDLGRKNGERFQILGRVDYADIRGCNLMYES